MSVTIKFPSGVRAGVRVQKQCRAVTARGPHLRAPECLTYTIKYICILLVCGIYLEKGCCKALSVLGTETAWRRYSCSDGKPQTALKGRFDTAKTTVVLLRSDDSPSSVAFCTNTGAH